MTINPMNLDETELVQGIREVVEMESPTTKPEAVNHLMDLVECQFRAEDLRNAGLPE
ncbi:MAG: hypothetical protein O7G32_14055 [SAR324 cluster bacterium]|nr:hypothetical protein [SAR324 cluster bacterium]